GDDYGAVRLLIILDQRDDSARQGKAGPVERMQVLRLLARCGTITDCRPPCLVVAEVGAARDLQPSLHPTRPDLEVIGAGGGEAQVAGGQQDHAIWEPEELEDPLG